VRPARFGHAAAKAKAAALSGLIGISAPIIHQVWHEGWCKGSS
jgi:hypothetical protein